MVINNFKFKIPALISFLLLNLVIFIIATTPLVDGYELTIYNAYPWYLWLCLVIIYGCGIIMLLQHNFSEKKSQWWKVGFLIIIFTNVIFLLLPEFRGYAFYGRADTATHLGLTRDILNTGYLGENNFYPIIHIFGVNLIKISSLKLNDISTIFHVLFYVLFITNIYALAKIISRQFGQSILIVAFASPLIFSFFHVSISPNFFCLFFLPCFLYCCYKRELLSSFYFEWTIILLLLAFVIVFFHPVTAFFIVIVLLGFKLSYYVYRHFFSQRSFKISEYGSMGKSNFGIIVIMLITLVAWYFMFPSIHRSFKGVVDALLYQTQTGLLQAQIDPIKTSGVTTFQIIELFINRHGAVFILLVISVVTSFLTLKKTFSKRYKSNYIGFTYAIQFLIAVFIGLIMLIGYFAEFTPIRVARLAILMGIIISGLTVYNFIKKRHEMKPKRENKIVDRLKFIMVFGTIMIIIILSLGNVYSSPRTYTPNQQVSWMEIEGTGWFEKQKNPNITIIANSAMEIWRFRHYNFGIDSSNIPRSILDSKRLPSHFGYNGNKSIAESLDFQNRYILIFQRNRLEPMFFPKNIRSKVPQWNEKDFIRLYSDSSVDRLYSNGEFECWLVGS